MRTKAPLQEIDRRIVVTDLGWNGTPCWQWIGHHRKRDGRATVGRNLLVYRELYKLKRGPIRPRSEFHHGCEHGWCINPWHLEQLTRKEHSARHGLVGVAAVAAARTHCVNGHPFDLVNTKIRVTPDGRRHRFCRECENATSRLRYANDPRVKARINAWKRQHRKSKQK